jgi:hypothetical protein
MEHTCYAGHLTVNLPCVNVKHETYAMWRMDGGGKIVVKHNLLMLNIGMQSHHFKHFIPALFNIHQECCDETEQCYSRYISL